MTKRRNAGILVILISLISLSAGSCSNSTAPKIQNQIIEEIQSQRIIQRAKVWVDYQVPYMSRDWSIEKAHEKSEGYRQDCSGFVSYAWELKKPGTNTLGLLNFGDEIAIVDLQPGDILNDASSHVVIFVHWLDKNIFKFLAYEENGGICSFCGKAITRELTIVPMQNGKGFTLKDEYGTLFDNYDPPAPGPYKAYRKSELQSTQRPQVLALSTVSSIKSTENSQTALVLDVSGSMSELDVNGSVKIDASITAARNLLDVISAEQQAFSSSFQHEVGLVTFSEYASTYHTLTDDIQSIQSSISGLYPGGGTAMAAGLSEGLALFDPSSDSKQILVLMSDGLPNIGLNSYMNMDYESLKSELINLANQAGSQGICVYTIGFGNPNAPLDSDAYIDQQLLEEIAAASTCGQYYSAEDAGQLAVVFMQLRHSSMGQVVFEQGGEIHQNETLNVGQVQVPHNQEQLVFTLNWPGSRLEPELVDPRGLKVTAAYPGATIVEGDTVSSVVIENPPAGVWRIAVFGRDVPFGVTSYYALMSLRANITNRGTPIWMWGSMSILAFGSLVTVMFIAAGGRKRTVGRRYLGRGAYLLIKGGEQSDKVIRLSESTLIGRSGKCQVSIPDLSVSRTHAIIYHTREGWFIRDEGSRAGTLVNGRSIESIRLQPGDKIEFGNTRATFQNL